MTPKPTLLLLDSPARPRRQRGAALLTAMIIVALVATMASAMIWQQFRAVQVEAAERARTQAAWILAGALDFARLILREDMKGSSRGAFTALNQPWATPLAESRLNSFLAVDKSNVDDAPDAFLSGSITDAQGKFNLRNLVEPAPQTTGQPGQTLQISPTSILAFETLCQAVDVDTGVATRIAQSLLDALSSQASGPTGGSGFLLPETISQLTWFGVDPMTIEALRPYVILLHDPTLVNVNTAPKEVLMAVIPGLNPGDAESLVQLRLHQEFQTTPKFEKELVRLMPVYKPPQPTVIDVRSDYFEISGRLRVADHVLTEQSLVKRDANGITTVLQRTRTASLEQVAK